MSLTPVWVSILRVKRQSDGEGDKIPVYSSDRVRYQATLNRQRRSSSEERLEDGAHGSPGPGVQEATRRVFCFKPPFPPLSVLTREVKLVAHGGVEAGKQFLVHDVRAYDWTLQVDAEIIE